MLGISKITSNSILIRVQKTISSEIDGEVVILSVDNSAYLCLNKVGSEIWNFLESPHTFAQIIEHMTNIYNVDYKECESDTKEYLLEMIKVGMIKVQ
jgi:hypothetical protein